MAAAADFMAAPEPKTSGQPTPDASRQRLAADYILAQNKGNPTNTVGNVLGQYDTAVKPPLAPGLPNLNPNPANAPAAGSKQRDPADVKWLQDNPNPKRVATFEKKYGQGAAAAYLQTNTGAASDMSP